MKKSSDKSVTELSFREITAVELSALCGESDNHLKQIEKYFEVDINYRGGEFQLRGEESANNYAVKVLQSIYREITDQDGSYTPSAEEIYLLLKEIDLSEEGNGKESTIPEVVIKTPRRVIRPRGSRQRGYLHQIVSQDLTFGIGPAGTGKSYLAVASAVDALNSDRVKRLVLVRPAVEAGEKLGFLPGDMSDKVDPYLRPLYDALYEMMGFDKVTKLIERKVIEVAPLAFMRGRTLNDSFIILDEAQNTTIEQMKMLLTRIGFGSTAVVTGDITQIDLPNSQPSGLRHVIDVLDGVEDIGFTFFHSIDVVRHPLVQKIVRAYSAEKIAE
jgi:phosphate starvation-inducible PhoH-like protein